MKKVLLFVGGLACFLQVFAQPGAPDPAFGNNGVQFYQATPSLFNNVLKVLAAPGNKYYVIYYTPATQYPQIKIARYQANGTLDMGYGTAGYSASLVVRFKDAALQPDGKLVVMGTTERNYYSILHDDLLVARFTENGVPDLSFNGTGIITKTFTLASYEFPTSITINDQLLVVTGYSVSLVGQFAFYNAAVFNLSGTSVGTLLLGNVIDNLQHFNPGYYNYSTALQGNKIVFAATTPDFSGGGNFFSLQRYLSTGEPDMNFGMNGTTTNGNDFFNGTTTVASQGDKIVVASYAYDDKTGSYGFAVGRYNNDGAADNSFNGNGRQTTYFGAGTPAVPKTILTTDQHLYIGGDSYNAATQLMEFTITRYKNNGLLSPDFGSNGRQVTGQANYHFSLQQLSIQGNRLIATGLAAGNQVMGVAARYLLEDNSVQLSCLADTTLSTDKGVCSAVVKGIDPIVTGASNTYIIQYQLTGATTGSGAGSANGLVFNKGITFVTYSVAGNATAGCTFKVTVLDKEAPVITAAFADPDVLWPPNKKMNDVLISYITTDNCSPVSTVLSVTSNEEDKNPGNDKKPKDWEIIDNHHIKLKAERTGKGKGRIYTITITATDASGNKSTSMVYVTVPHHIKQSPQNHRLTDPQQRIAGSNDQGNFQVKVLPNPSTTYFTLQTNSNSNEPLTLRVINQQGSVIETRANLNAHGSLQVGHQYRSGMYFAEMVQGNKRIVVKLVKIN